MSNPFRQARPKLDSVYHFDLSKKPEVGNRDNDSPFHKVVVSFLQLYLEKSISLKCSFIVANVLKLPVA